VKTCESRATSGENPGSILPLFNFPPSLLPPAKNTNPAEMLVKAGRLMAFTPVSRLLSTKITTSTAQGVARGCPPTTLRLIITLADALPESSAYGIHKWFEDAAMTLPTAFRTTGIFQHVEATHEHSSRSSIMLQVMGDWPITQGAEETLLANTIEQIYKSSWPLRSLTMDVIEDCSGTEKDSVINIKLKDNLTITEIDNTHADLINRLKDRMQLLGGTWKTKNVAVEASEDGEVEEVQGGKAFEVFRAGADGRGSATIKVGLCANSSAFGHLIAALRTSWNVRHMEVLRLERKEDRVLV
jgi:hypothetical protein